eukprot:3636170-Pleurochrysis_carterae.AAC.2
MTIRVQKWSKTAEIANVPKDSEENRPATYERRKQEKEKKERLASFPLPSASSEPLSLSGSPAEWLGIAMAQSLSLLAFSYDLLAPLPIPLIPPSLPAPSPPCIPSTPRPAASPAPDATLGSSKGIASAARKTPEPMSLRGC